MEHDEKMASIRLKKHKYNLRYGSTPHMSGSPTPAVAAVTQTKEDKQIEILRLQIRLAELNRDSAAASAHASASAPSHTSLSQMPRNSLQVEEASTPSSGMSSSLSYFNGHSCHDGHNNSFVDNSCMISNHGYVPDASGETSSGVDTTSWSETFNFAA